MNATLVGLGAREALAAGGEGAVLASFPKACYVTLPGGLVALVAREVRPGPIYLVLDGSPPAPPRGTRVVCTEEGLALGDVGVLARGAGTWAGALPAPSDVRAGIDLIVGATRTASARSALSAEPFVRRALRAYDRLLSGWIEEATRLLAGLGPGLTPSGDDALAGILFALRAGAGTGIEPDLARAMAAADVGAISRAFLVWAGRGQALANAHDLLTAGAAGDATSAASASEALGQMGETSGADFLLGMTWGLQAARRAAAAYPWARSR